MNKRSILYICSTDIKNVAVATGYVDALEYLGYRTLIVLPAGKFQIREYIENYDVGMIFVACRGGLQHLPIDIINDKDIAVVISALPKNEKGLFIEDRYAVATDYDLDVAKRIRDKVVHTNLSENLWNIHMSGWAKSGICLHKILFAGNLLKATPEDFTPKRNCVVIDNVDRMVKRAKDYYCMVIDRISLLGGRSDVWGNHSWNGVYGNRQEEFFYSAKRLATLYAQSAVCLNIHSQQNIDLRAYENERTFFIPLCGGIQVTDQPFESTKVQVFASNSQSKYMSMCEVVSSWITNSIEGVSRPDFIKKSVQHFADNHTYFNRLEQIFVLLDKTDEANECSQKKQKLIQKHMWDIEDRLAAFKQRKPYEEKIAKLVRG